MSEKSKAQRKADYEREHAIGEEHRAATLSGPAGMVDVGLPGIKATVVMSPKTYATDSYGWQGQTKVTLPDGRRIQVSILATVINSGPFKP